MKKTLSVFRCYSSICFLLFIFLFCLNSTYISAGEIPEYAPGSLIIKFSSIVKEKDFAIRIELNTVKTNISSIDLIGAKYNVKSFKPFYFRLLNKIEDKEMGLDRMYVFQFPAFSDMKKIAKEYAKDVNIEYAHPNHLFEATANPNDIYYQYNYQWGLQKISAPAAWDVTQGSSGIILGILDTGVDLDHPDLNDNLVSSAYWRDEVDIDTTAYKNEGDTLYSDEDYTVADNFPNDVIGHGTHVAGIASGETNNSIGIAGLGWNCKIMPIRAGFKIKLPPKGDLTALFEEDDWGRALDWAINNNVNVVNMSFGRYYSPGDTIPNDELMIKAYNNKITLIAAIGNLGVFENNFFPACFDKYVIAVGATTMDDIRWNDGLYATSNSSDSLDVTAPGKFIMSTLIDGEYGYETGTSMAAPFVSGLAALLLSKNSNLTPYEIERIIECTAKDLGTVGFDIYYGHGRIQAASALNLIVVPHDYATIQAALSSASSGDTIFVGPGIYTPPDNLTINTGITLMMPCSGITVKMGSNKYIDVNGGRILAENVRFIYNGTGSPGAWSGIWMRGDGAPASSLTNCTIKYGYNGVYVANTSSHQISGCMIDSCYNGIQAAYSGSFNADKDTIKHCSNLGMNLIHNSAAANISNTIIENNSTDGIYFDGASPNIWKSRIKYNQRYGLHIEDFSDPDLASTSSHLQNMIYENDSVEVSIEWYSDPVFGKTTGGYPSTQNVIKDNSGTLISLMFNCDVDAYYVWWGSNPPDSARFYRYSNSYLDYYPWATSAPDWSGKAAGTIANLASPYQRAKLKIYEGKNKEAIALLKEQIESYPESDEARHALVKLYTMNIRGLYDEDKDGLIRYLSYVIYAFPSLQPMALELSAMELTNRGFYQDVVDIYENLVSTPETTNEYVLQRAFRFYLYKMGNSEKSSEYISKLQAARISESKLSDLTTEFERMKNEIDPYAGEMKKNPLFSLEGYDLARIAAQVPIEYKLYPVYPNPFNPSTTISFDLPEASSVLITIYNVLGQNVATLINGRLPAGRHEREWNAARFSSGIYFVRMQAGDFVKTTKITLLK